MEDKQLWHHNQICQDLPDLIIFQNLAVSVLVSPTQRQAIVNYLRTSLAWKILLAHFHSAFGQTYIV